MFETRVDSLKREILRDLRKINAWGMTIGIEDIHDQVLAAIGKTQTFDQIQKGLKVAKELDYRIISSFIIGLPSQTKEQMLENMKFSSNIDDFSFPCLAPYPGSPIFYSPEKYGLSILSRNYELYDGYELVTESKTFPLAAQKEVREIVNRHKATQYLKKDTTFFFDLKIYERVLEIGFEAWVKEWKKAHSSGWN